MLFLGALGGGLMWLLSWGVLSLIDSATLPALTIQIAAAITGFTIGAWLEKSAHSQADRRFRAGNQGPGPGLR